MPLNIDWQQILLHLFNFVVLFAILYFLLYKPVKQFMDNRTEYYKKLDEEAKANVAEAEKAKEEYLSKLDSSDDEIQKEMKKAHIEIEKITAEKIKDAQDEASKIIANAHRNVEAEREKMLKEAQKEITGMVAAAAEKLVSKATTSEAFDEFLATAERGEVNE